MQKKQARIVLLSVALFLGAVSSSQAQDDIAVDSPQVMMFQGDEALQNGDFVRAERVFSLLIESFGTNAMRTYGPWFGIAYYGRGIALVSQGKAAEAIDDFQNCVENFSNEGYAGADGGRNPYSTLALFQWGTALRMAENYEEALDKFERFGDIATREEARLVGRAQWEYEFALCYIELGDLEEAGEHIETLTEKRVEFGVQFQMLADILARYTKAAIENDAEDVAIEMIAANRGISLQAPYEAAFLFSQYLGLAEEANAAGMLRLQMLIYSLIPQEQLLRDSIDLASQLPENFGLRVTAERAEQVLQEMDGLGKPLDLMVLLNEAAFYESSGSDSAAFAAYRTLESYFDSENQYAPDILFGAARTGSRLGLLSEVEYYGRNFLERFPTHEYAPAVRQLLLEGMFYDGKYAEALRIGRDVRPQVANGTEQAEMVDYVIAGSLYFLGEYKEAEQVIESWLNEYSPAENKVRQEWIRFFEADNKGKLQQWSTCGALVDKFVLDYPESSWLDRALFGRAQAHYYLRENEQCLLKIAELREKAPQTILMDQVFVLEGQVQLALEEEQLAEEKFVQGLELAGQNENWITAGEALFNLIGLLVSDEGRDAETIEYYEKFIQDYWENPYRVQVVVISVPLLTRGERLDEALANLEKTFLELGRNPDAFGLTEVIVAYTKAFMGAASPNPDAQMARAAELTEHFGELLIPHELTTLRSRLLMSRIKVYQDLVDEFEDNSQPEIDAKNEIMVGFEEMRNRFPLEDLDPFSLMSLAGDLYQNQMYEEAANYFEEAVNRNDQSTLPKAVLGLGQALARSPNAEDQIRAAELFERVLTDFVSETKLQGQAVYALAKMYESQQQWGLALEQWDRYLTNQSWTEFNAEATYRYAQAADRLGQLEKAMAMYSRTVQIYSSLFPYAIPSVVRVAELVLEVREDKQLAYETLYTARRRYQDSVNRAVLVNAGYDTEQVAEILSSYQKMEDLLLELEKSPEVTQWEEEE